MTRKAGFFQRLFGLTPKHHGIQAPSPDARVTPDATRCVQCGVCGYNCPVGIPVRDYARQGLIVEDVRCVQCGQCVEACPRGTLRWERVFAAPVEATPHDDLINRLLAQESPKVDRAADAERAPSETGRRGT